MLEGSSVRCPGKYCDRQKLQPREFDEYTNLGPPSPRRDRGGLVVRSQPQLQSQSAQDSNPESTKDPPRLWALCTINMTWVKRLPTDVVRCGSSDRVVPAQVPSSSSDRGSKL
ncbi:hypothetical protein AVEN_119490-1 [Araneus ventricosus]|uniref:Uncharacterized protein n=1 Tax=Araneus ventricosus TaxID=182803 RepID=A0A4Y2UDJ6_ARAVE|nr:hypothetical protein AVEN_119490-1 [Araneus ventricosus]